MDEKTLDRLRQALMQRKTELSEDLEQLQTELRDLSIEQDAEGGSAGNHFADDGSSLGEQERISTIGENFREQIIHIDRALERMDAGEYGKCQRCGRQIPIERLEAIPFTPFCIDCQKFIEKQVEFFGAAAAQS